MTGLLPSSPHITGYKQFQRQPKLSKESVTHLKKLYQKLRLKHYIRNFPYSEEKNSRQVGFSVKQPPMEISLQLGFSDWNSHLTFLIQGSKINLTPCQQKEQATPNLTS